MYDANLRKKGKQDWWQKKIGNIVFPISSWRLRRVSDCSKQLSLRDQRQSDFNDFNAQQKKERKGKESGIDWVKMNVRTLMEGRKKGIWHTYIWQFFPYGLIEWSRLAVRASEMWFTSRLMPSLATFTECWQDFFVGEKITDQRIACQNPWLNISEWNLNP